MREGSLHIRESAQHAADSTVDYIRVKPVKAVLISAAVGAALMAMASMLSRSRG